MRPRSEVLAYCCLLTRLARWESGFYLLCCNKWSNAKGWSRKPLCRQSLTLIPCMHVSREYFQIGFLSSQRKFAPWKIWRQGMRDNPTWHYALWWRSLYPLKTQTSWVLWSLLTALVLQHLYKVPPPFQQLFGTLLAIFSLSSRGLIGLSGTTFIKSTYSLDLRLLALRWPSS